MEGNTPSSEFDLVKPTTKDEGNVWQPKPDTEQKPTPKPEPEPKDLYPSRN